MEKTTTTIEIKQEVSIALLWLAGGICLVTLAFFLASQSNELWTQLYSAGVAAIVYLVSLLLYVLRKPVSMKTRLSATACFIVVLGIIVFQSIQSDTLSHWQKNDLLQMNSETRRGSMLRFIPTPMLETLKIYYQQRPTKNETLSQIFRRLNGDPTVGSNIYKPLSERDDFKIIVQSLEPDRVVLVAQGTFEKGRNPEFVNYNGQKGLVQEKCVLIGKGIKYESEN